MVDVQSAGGRLGRFKSSLATFVLLCALPRVAAKAVCPVPLIEVASEFKKGDDGNEVEAEGLRLVAEGLQYLAGLRPPLRLVPALGVYRGGKSLLLNRLMGLKAPYSGGFGVGHGQQTFTRGIEVCAEEVEGLGSVVWMDTEGLFSSEEARSAYGPKIFSLALLFSSTVLLNSVKVFNDQFFSFFSEQQQLTRILKQGLAQQGLPPEMLLPGNLSVTWVLQQPIQYDKTGVASMTQLENFLNIAGDESRTRVRRDFKHLLHEIPVASNDIRTWSRLDQLEDSELVPDYLNATSHLRERLFEELRVSRPLQAESIPSQLRMYVEVVQTEQFSGALAREAFEETEIGTLCESYTTIMEERAGPLPSTSVAEAVEEASREILPRREEAAETYHLGSDWLKRLDRCLRRQEQDFRKRNSEIVMGMWKSTVSAAAEEGRCFFIGGLVNILSEYEGTYGHAFDASLKADAIEYASALQRTRLVECLRVRDLLWPFVPWLAWPICSIYLRGGLVSGAVSMAIHAVIIFGVYVVLQLLHQLPPYLDVDYPVLRAHPLLLDLVMRTPPLVPWGSMSRAFGLIGLAFSTWRLIRCVLYYARPAGQKHTASQMVNVELKLNILLKRSESAFRHNLVSAAMEAVDYLECGRPRSAARSLVKGLRLVSNIGEDDCSLAAAIDAGVRHRARNVSKISRLPALPADMAHLAHLEETTHRLEEKIASGDLDELVSEMISIADKIIKSQQKLMKLCAKGEQIGQQWQVVCKRPDALAPPPGYQADAIFHSPSPVNYWARPQDELFGYQDSIEPRSASGTTPSIIRQDASQPSTDCEAEPEPKPNNVDKDPNSVNSSPASVSFVEELEDDASEEKYSEDSEADDDQASIDDSQVADAPSYSLISRFFRVRSSKDAAANDDDDKANSSPASGSFAEELEDYASEGKYSEDSEADDGQASIDDSQVADAPSRSFISRFFRFRSSKDVAANEDDAKELEDYASEEKDSEDGEADDGQASIDDSQVADAPSRSLISRVFRFRYAKDVAANDDDDKDDRSEENEEERTEEQEGEKEEEVYLVESAAGDGAFSEVAASSANGGDREERSADFEEHKVANEKEDSAACDVQAGSEMGYNEDNLKQTNMRNKFMYRVFGWCRRTKRNENDSCDLEEDLSEVPSEEDCASRSDKEDVSHLTDPQETTELETEWKSELEDIDESRSKRCWRVFVQQVIFVAGVSFGIASAGAVLAVGYAFGCLPA